MTAVGPGEREFFSFLAMVLAGGLIGLAYDLGAAARVLAGRRSLVPALVDTAAVLAAGLGAGAIWFRLTWGERRGYLLLAVLLGAGCYRLLASPLLGRLLVRGALAARGARLGAGTAVRRLFAAARGRITGMWAGCRSWWWRAGRFL